MVSDSLMFVPGGFRPVPVPALGIAPQSPRALAQVKPAGGATDGSTSPTMSGAAGALGTVIGMVSSSVRRKKQAQHVRSLRKGIVANATQLAEIETAENTPAALLKSSGRGAGGKSKVVVLGSGWGAVSFIQGLSEEDASKYDITVVSMRNHFLYTPLLPTCTMGSIEERSICTPIRSIIAGKADFIEARCEHIDPAAKTVRCGRAGNPPNRADMSYERFPEHDVDGKLSFTMDYDILIYAIGAVPQTFNCPGVEEHTFMFKEVDDARKIRNKISDVFEKASLPGCSPEERDALLTFVIVGGGPTGVEVAADLCDFIRDDVGFQYPKLVDHVSVKLINTVEHLLSTYDRSISDASLQVFRENGVEVLKGYMVTSVTANEIHCKVLPEKTDAKIPYGCIVWCTGIKQNKLSEQLKDSILEMNVDRPEIGLDTLQENRQGVVTDEWLQVKGSWGTIYCLGDAATTRPKRITRFAQELFEEGDEDGNGTLCVAEMKELFRSKKETYPQLEEYANYFDTASNDNESDDVRQAVTSVFAQAAKVRQAATELTTARVTSQSEKGSIDISEDAELDKEEFTLLLRNLDKNLRSFPATAQVAAQQGKYLAKAFATGIPNGENDAFAKSKHEVGPFTYFHKGALAYLGNGSAAFDVPIIGAITGPIAGLAWKGYETISQVSLKGQVLVGFDWIRTQFLGRDTSRF